MNGTTVTGPAPTLGATARVVCWPHDPSVAHVVLLDHQMVPAEADVHRWVAVASQQGARVVRTGALFPSSTTPFVAAGFEPVDTLALLELDLLRWREPDAAASRTVRLTTARFPAAAAIDRAAFPEEWASGEHALADTLKATPHHRARVILDEGTPVAFSISGRAGRDGYLQRLAVHPVAQRNGHGTALVRDALRWMRRRGATTALVNTGHANAAALALYETFGFHRRNDDLTILQRPTNPAGVPPG